jgi:hypothetical protein
MSHLVGVSQKTKVLWGRISFTFRMANQSEHFQDDAGHVIHSYNSEGELDFTFDEDEDIMAIPSNPDAPPMPRTHWGNGLEAVRASRYRCYDASLSPIFRFMQQDHRIVTRTRLRELIEAVVRYTPEDQRPLPPSRNQRRAKNGLVMWLDHNSALVWRYLEAMCSIAVVRMAPTVNM